MASTPVVAFLSACGFAARTPTADQLLVDSIIYEKNAILANLADVPIVASQQQEHIDALLPFSSNQPMATPTALPSNNYSTSLADLSTQITSRALSATDHELSRLLLLIAASDAVHAQVTA